ncbi:MAG: hypothetical protein JSR15_04590, partial [Proteobacteria bacterium]|nr:hypothetical protein [Pseudomonadota bacterium]
MIPSRFESLDAALASLPRGLKPGRDLWPAIEQDIERDPVRDAANGGAPAARVARMPWPTALAASVLLASLAGALCWSVARDRSNAEQLAQRAAGSGA